MMTEGPTYLNDQIDASQLSMHDMTSKVCLEGVYNPCNNQENLDDKSKKKKNRVPRRVLHFSDGSLEEYSTDEEEEEEKKKNILELQLQQQKIDPSKMSWPDWLGYQASSKGSTALAACDYVGENIAYFLGITSPKYQYELEEYQRTLKEEEEERKEVAAALVGWSSSPEGASSVTTDSTLASPMTPSLAQTLLLAGAEEEQQLTVVNVPLPSNDGGSNYTATSAILSAVPPPTIAPVVLTITDSSAATDGSAATIDDGSAVPAIAVLPSATGVPAPVERY